jgi:hypothetical protein
VQSNDRLPGDECRQNGMTLGYANDLKNSVSPLREERMRQAVGLLAAEDRTSIDADQWRLGMGGRDVVTPVDDAA